MRHLVTWALAMAWGAVVADAGTLASPTGDVYEVEFRFHADELPMGEPGAPDGMAALTPVILESGSAGFLAWGDGCWNEVSASGVVPATGVWMEAKFSVRTVDGEKLVSYLVKSEGDYIRLQTVGGRGWFRTGVSDIEPAMTFAGAGEGEVLGTLAEESGETYAFDVSRPKAGTALAPELPAFLQSGDFSCAWRRADWAKNYESTNVAETTSYVPSASDYEHWLQFSVMNGGLPVLTREVFFSKLPVCYLTTDDGGFPTSAKEKHDGWLRIQGNADFKEQYNGAMVVNVRGNTSAGYPKKPYKLKLDKKASPFGLGSVKSKHWVLLANMPDMSNMRNKLAFDFAASIGVMGMKSTWVEVVLNGRYDGLYQFCEHI